MKTRTCRAASLSALGALLTSAHAVTINTTWLTDPGAAVKADWASVTSYYESLFLDSYTGETWNITCDWKALSGSVAQGGPEGGMAGATLATQPNALTGLIKTNVAYTSALANHLARSAVVTGENLTVTFNANTTWDFSTTSKANNKESLYTTAIHEVAHGLGFIGSDKPAGGWNSSGPGIFDYYLGLGSNAPTNLLGLSNTELAAAFISDNVYWTGTNGLAGNAGLALKMYAPNPYNDGSSMSHLDYSVNTQASLMMYPADAANLPVNFSFSTAELGMLKDMGYDILETPIATAGVPEPSSALLLAMSAAALLMWKRRTA